MFELCIKEPNALARHRAAPLARERERFVAHLHGCGTSPVNLRSAAAFLLQFVTILKMRTLRNVSQEEIERAAKRWIDNRHRYSNHRPGRWSGCYFRWIARKWLRYEGRLVPPRPIHQPFSEELADYVGRMTAELGLAETTVYERRLGAAKFLRWFSRKHRRLSKLSLQQVDTYLAEGAQKWKLITLKGECDCLRAFLRHAGYRGWCPKGFADGLKSPPLRREVFEPQGPKWSAVLKLLRSINGRDAVSVRAKAIISLFAVYGLRSSEALRLRLSDINWQRNCFTVRRGKRGGLQQFPIQPEVGEAIRRYVDNVRPPCGCPEVFVTRWKPYRAMRTHTMASVMGSRMKALGIVSKHHGPQSLRHSCATQLLSRGAHLQDIADFLGHRSCESVRIYAKFSLESLREVVEIDLTAGL